MSISYTPKKIKKIIVFLIILALIISLAYAIGTLSIGRAEKRSISIVYPQKQAEIRSNEANSEVREVTSREVKGATIQATEIKKPEVSGSVVASKKGTKYHLPTCSGAKTISEENKITFPNAEAAKKAGYSPAKNCKGLNP